VEVNEADDDEQRTTAIKWRDENGAELKQVHVLDYHYNRRGHPIRKRPGKIEMCTKTQKIVLGISGAVIALIILIMVIVLFTSPQASPTTISAPTQPGPVPVRPPAPTPLPF
jgi:hypothetical protein